MKTNHIIRFENAKNLRSLEARSVDLVVTSPPYPMIKMWDVIFAEQDPKIQKALECGDGSKAFDLMHKILFKTWRQVYRVLNQGGLVCINIGDAVRTIKGIFSLYSNHSRILQDMLAIGFTPLPDILWRKQTNAPNKFMGSGMLPAGAYVTYEHEYILIFRKGEKREFLGSEVKKNRRESAYFWEERNVWFSDVWMDIKGQRQKNKNRDFKRNRSGAFPFELAYRLISMYSVKNDWVLDPFLGSGTTSLAAMVSGRNSIGFELDASFRETVVKSVEQVMSYANEYIRERLLRHVDFAVNRISEKGPLKHTNSPYGFPVVTAQEKELLINELESIEMKSCKAIFASYRETPSMTFHEKLFTDKSVEKASLAGKRSLKKGKKRVDRFQNYRQLKLFTE